MCFQIRLMINLHNEDTAVFNLKEGFIPFCVKRKTFVYKNYSILNCMLADTVTETIN